MDCVLCLLGCHREELGGTPSPLGRARGPMHRRNPAGDNNIGKRIKGSGPCSLGLPNGLAVVSHSLGVTHSQQSAYCRKTHTCGRTVIVTVHGTQCANKHGQPIVASGPFFLAEMATK